MIYPKCDNKISVVSALSDSWNHKGSKLEIPFINFRKILKEVIQTDGEALDFQRFPKDISRRCLDATGSSMITLIVLPHCGIKSKTLYLIPPDSHYTDTGSTSPSPTPEFRVPSGEQLVPLLTTLVCCGHGIEPVTSRSRSGLFIYCATEAGTFVRRRNDEFDCIKAFDSDLS